MLYNVEIVFCGLSGAWPVSNHNKQQRPDREQASNSAHAPEPIGRDNKTPLTCSKPRF